MAGAIGDRRHERKARLARARYSAGQQNGSKRSNRFLGIIKQPLGFRRCSLRGLAKVSLERTLVTLAYNLKRLYQLGAMLSVA